MRDRAAENEATRLDARHLVDAHARIGLHQFVHGAPEGTRIAQKRGDVAEVDAGLRVIRNGTDGTRKIHLGRSYRSAIQYKLERAIMKAIGCGNEEDTMRLIV